MLAPPLAVMRAPRLCATAQAPVWTEEAAVPCVYEVNIAIDRSARVGRSRAHAPCALAWASLLPLCLTLQAVRACTAVRPARPRGTPARQLLLAPVPVSADAPWLSASLRPRAAQAEFEAWLVPHIHAITDLPGFGKAIVYEARQRASLLI